ncbi:S-adenosyl-L-methionine-dependent methyltransferase [Thozetella sp. PMI_491]|nr:S-adenosyl-L-methionine-dependent methyltransferase [Thozetella sp. PMI_491]
MTAEDLVLSGPEDHGHVAPGTDQPTTANDQQQEQAVTSEYAVTRDVLPLVSWGEGSSPLMPSVAHGETLSNDGDSTVASFRSSIISAQSGASDFVEEHGRTYHRYKEGKYPLPNDQIEQERLDLQHALFLLTSQGNLSLAPIGDSVRNVLDIATGTGIWAIEFGLHSLLLFHSDMLTDTKAQTHPGSLVLGTDLSPIQPRYIPPNCGFKIHDAEDEWLFGTKFDYIHGRAMISCFKNPLQVVRSAYDTLEPGGWLELQDFYFPWGYADNAEPKDTAIYKWNQLCLEGSTKSGRPWTHAQHYKRYLEEAGFEEVVERRFYWPMGPWAEGKYYQTLGRFMQQVILDGLHGISFKVITALGWSAEEIKLFLDDVRKELTSPSVHTYMNIVFVYGRKPLQSG